MRRVSQHCGTSSSRSLSFIQPHCVLGCILTACVPPSLLRRRLLSAGYAVVFLHRTGSKRPYSHAILDAVTAALDEPPPTMSPVSGADDTEQADTAAMLDALLASVVETSERHGGSLGALAAARRDGRLLELPYSSVADYLHKLRSASHAVSALQERGLILLAAAVSDFYVPTHKLVEHKIQSDPSAAAAAAAPGLSLHLDPVPKVLFPLKQQWAPRCCVISFKLETDEALLLKKAAGAIQAYGVDGVVANLLDKRYTQVQLVVPSASQPSGAGQEHPPAAAPVSLQLPVAVPGASITSKPLATSAADATAVGPSFQVITICTGSSSPSSPGAGSSSQQQSAASSSPPLPGLASPPAPAPAAVASTVPVMPLEDALAESIAALHGAHIARTQRSDVTSTDEPRMK